MAKTPFPIAPSDDDGDEEPAKAQPKPDAGDAFWKTIKNRTKKRISASSKGSVKSGKKLAIKKPPMFSK